MARSSRGIVFQLLDIEVEPRIVQLDCRRPVEEPCIGSLVNPGPQFGRGHLSHRIDLLIAIPVLPVRQFRSQIPEERNRVRGLGAASLVGGGNCFKQNTVEQIDIEIRRCVLAQHVPGEVLEK